MFPLIMHILKKIDGETFNDLSSINFYYLYSYLFVYFDSRRDSKFSKINCVGFDCCIVNNNHGEYVEIYTLQFKDFKEGNNIFMNVLVI